MLALVNDQALPPMEGKTVDWTEIAAACRLAAKPSTKLMRVGRHGFDAIIRWVNANTATPRNRTSSPSGSVRISKARTADSRRSANRNSKSGAKPKPIDEFPVPCSMTIQSPSRFRWHWNCTSDALARPITIFIVLLCGPATISMRRLFSVG